MPCSEERFRLDVLSKIPLRNEPPLPPDWLHTEMLERFRVLMHASLEEGMNVIEIGCGPHALATVPLVYLVGDTGRVVAVDRARWRFFEEIVVAAGLKKRIIPLRTDARSLPFPYRIFDLAVLVHGIRSLENEENIVRIVSEMLRVADTVFIAETLPVARNERQRAHLELYNLREEIFEALYGRKDDIHYFPLREAAGAYREGWRRDNRERRL